MTYGETDPKNIYIGLIFGLMMLILGFSFLGHDISQNPTNFNDMNITALNNSLNYQNDMQTGLNSTRYALQYASTADVGPLGVVGALLMAGWNSIKTFFSTIGYATVFLSGIGGLLSIPAYVIGLFISVITIMIVAWILYLIFKMR